MMNNSSLSKFKNYIPITCIQDNSETLVYSETLKQFTSIYPIGPYHWWNVNDSLYSVAPTEYFITGKIYLYNQLPILTYWNRNKTAVISWLVNGQSEKDNAQPFQKRFDSMVIVCNQDNQANVQLDFNTIKYNTDGQTSTQPFNTDGSQFWRDPVWLENRWQVPIDVSGLISNEYTIDSCMKGAYLKTTLSYNKKLQGYIKEIITNFQISFA
jgi:hypothetical protein